MSIGYPLTKSDLDNKMGSLFVSVRDNLFRCSQMNALLNDTAIIPNDAFLTSMGYTSGEVTTLRAAFTDLGGTGNSLYRIAIGVGTVSPANDFYFNAKKLAGVVLT